MTTKIDWIQLTRYLKTNSFDRNGRISLTTDGLRPTEEYDGRLRVKLLDDDAESQEIPCSSYAEAIDLVKEHQHDVTVAKIVD